MTAVVLPAVPRVLIAESDPWVRETLSELVLSVRGDIELEMCTDGRQAIEWMKKHLPDLVIAARELPAIDGLSLLRGIRNLRRQPPIPFILISNRSDAASVREVLPLAPTAYLTKPIDTVGLKQRLEGLLLGRRAAAPGDMPALTPGLTLMKFLEKRRDVADGAPLFVDVPNAIQLSQGASGLDATLLEQELRNDPHITAVLIAAANTAAQHLGKPVQTLGGAMAVLGAPQTAAIASGLAKKRMAVLTSDALLAKASQFWTLSQRTADYARILGGMLELDVERCFCAGMLQSLGDLAVLGCLQEWLLAGGELNEQAIDQALEQYSASFGSALRTRWRLPLELRELIAAVYQYNTGIYKREVLAMNLAGQMAQLGEEESVTQLLKTKSAKLLKLSVGDLQRLRKKLTGVTDPSLLAPLVVEPEEGEEEGVEDDGPDLLDLTPEPPSTEEPEAESEPTIEDVPKG
ncbi:HDOD domain-containing protein [Pseudomonas viridiflava]|uniref:HDOD domain-containing protein n=1 Tax=Pseudomonas viridiflava TaxID=33069 RepID=UPI000F028689|nr:HDOD domain-containing protein [Pseudomonas viridiflava]